MFVRTDTPDEDEDAARVPVTSVVVPAKGRFF
jgi:hypothetical protein